MLFTDRLSRLGVMKKSRSFMSGSEQHTSIVKLIAPVLEPLAVTLEFFGIGVIVIGVFVASVAYL